MICTAGFDGYFKKVNPSFTRVLGYSEDELVAKPFIDFVHPDDVESTLAEGEKLSQGVAALEFTNRYRCKDGTYRWLEWTSNPDIETQTLYAVAHDVTERRLMEEKLQDAERRLRLSYDNAAIGMAWVASEGAYLRVNNAFCEMVGYTQEELLQMKSEELSHPDDKQVGNETLRTLIEGTKESGVVEKRYIHRDGHIIHLRFHVVFIENNIKGTGYFFTQVVDISEQVEVENALRESELRFRSVFEDSPIAIDFFDSDGNFLFANKAALDMFGLSTADGMKRLNILKDPNTPPDVIERVRRGENVRYESYFDFEKVKEQELYESSRSGKIHLDAVLSPLRLTPDGSVKGYLVQLLDISERKIAEEMQLRLTEELENIVEERTSELKKAQKELIRKQRLATLGQISGGIGHELRNPLAAIKNAGYLLNLLIKNPTQEVTDSLEILNIEVANCEKIISSLLDFARPKPLRLQKVRVNETLEQVLDRLSKPNCATIDKEFSDDLPIILADPTQLELVFSNLITNALQSMANGGQLTINTTSGPDNQVLISVSDTGEGVPEENLSQLFEPLFTTKAKGIGLGLTIVKSVIDAHKGSISVSSKVGEGTRFDVILPVSPGGEM
jgi:PAS domain S-box-containing protein